MTEKESLSLSNEPLLTETDDAKVIKKQKKTRKTMLNKMRRYRKKARRRLGTVIILTIVLALSVYFSPIIGKYVAYLKQGEPINEVTGEILGRKTIAIRRAVLGETRDKKALVVMEQDIEVESEISSGIADWEIFSKTKKIHSFGTGVYTIDLSSLDEKSITVDEDTKAVTVTIPRSMLSYINTDVTKAAFEETERGWLAFGDIKLTQEQQNILETEIYNTMYNSLDTDALLAKADDIALLKVWEIFYPIIAAVSNEYVLNVVFP